MALPFSFLQPLAPWINLQTCALAIFAATAIVILFIRKKRNHEGNITDAEGGNTLLGHALAYKKDPAAFLLRQSRLIGSLFRINLAGRRMAVLCGGNNDDERALTRKIATMPERILSARDAVSSIGFEYTLGKANVYEGTDFHKRIIKGHLYSHEETTPRIVAALSAAFDIEITDGGQEEVAISDFLGLVRRCVLRAVIDVFLGTAFLQPSSTTQKEDLSHCFLDSFMELQDAIEEATAAAAVLPRWLSLTLVLRPVERSRLRLQRIIAKMIRDAWSVPESRQGPWLLAFRESDIGVEKASEFVVGLLFAAHKNPAIGSAQAYLFLRLEGSATEQAEALSESRAFLGNPSNQSLSQCQHLSRCCLETLRLTSHALGAIRTARQSIRLGKATSSASGGEEIHLYPGEEVAISHIVPSLDQSMWGKNAKDYVPTRDEWTKEESYPDEYKFTTFSHGLHKCPGQKVALIIMQSVVSILLSYKIDFLQVPDISFERATLAQRDGDVVARVLSKRRKQQ